MKIASLIILTLVPALLSAQNFSIDSSKKSMDVSGDFKGAAVHLPGVKKQPEFPGGKKAWQDFLESNIDKKIPIANKAIPGTYKIMIRFIVGSDGKLWGI